MKLPNMLPKRLSPAPCLLALAMGITGPVALAEQASGDRSELVLVGGINNLRHRDHQDYEGVQARLGASWHGIHPYVQAVVSGHGSDYAGGGLSYSIDLPKSMKITLGSGPNWFRHDPLDPGLGSAIEFSSWIEVSGTIGNRKVGIDFSHVSNAHLGRINPGSEGLGVSVELWKW